MAAAAGEVLTGSIVAVIPKADIRSRTLPVRVTMDNQRAKDLPRFAAGMSAVVEIALEPLTSRLVVRKDALVLGGATLVHAVLEGGPGGETVVRPVDVGLRAGDPGRSVSDPFTRKREGADPEPLSAHPSCTTRDARCRCCSTSFNGRLFIRRPFHRRQTGWNLERRFNHR